MLRYLLAASLLFPLSAQAAATHWVIDPAKSSLTFAGTQQGAPFEGRFKAFSGTVDLDPAQPRLGRAEVTIDINSVTTNSPDRDAYLPQDNWFAAAKYPQAKYAVESFNQVNGEYVAYGKLTIRNKTMPLTLPFKLAIDGRSAHATGQVKLKRLDYGVGQGEWKDTSTVGDEVTVKVDVVAAAR